MRAPRPAADTKSGTIVPPRSRTQQPMNILGIAYSMHESSACLVQDGELVFACAEERLSRKNKDGSFPGRAIRAALDFAGLKPDDVDHVAIGWPKPFVTCKHNPKTPSNGRWPWTWQ